MTTVLLVRHGAHDWLGRGFAGREPGVALNERGRAEALALVARLQQVALDAIYSSPQPRTRETAQPLARARGLPVTVAEAFDEVDLGEWSGRSFDEVRGTPAWTHWLASRSTAQPPGGEPFAQVAQRAMAGLRALQERHPQGCVIVFSHADVIKAAVASVLGLSLDRLERFEIAPVSVTEVAIGTDWAQLRGLNRLA